MKMLAFAMFALAILSVPVVAQDDPYRRPPGYTWGDGSTGYGRGTGYNGGYGFGWVGGLWRPGFISGYPGFGTIWSGTGGYYGYGGSYPGYWGREGPYGTPYGAATAAGPLSAQPHAVDRSPQMTSFREIEEGRRRFRLGDYRGAVDSFRSAVVATTDSPVAQAWFAVSLVALGEGRNADKALRAAVAGGLAQGAVSLDGLFRDDKERVRMIVTLAKMGTEGSLAAAYALSLSGEPVKLQQLAEKDPAARLLLPKP